MFTFLLPLVNTLFLYKAGKISSLYMQDANERLMPYLGAVVYYIALFMLFRNSGLSSFYGIIVLAAIAALVTSLLINYKFKISAHMVGVGGVVGVLFGMIYRLQIELLYPILLMLFIAGIIGYARLKLKAHSPTQVYFGFVVGCVTELLFVIYYR